MLPELGNLTEPSRHGAARGSRYVRIARGWLITCCMYGRFEANHMPIQSLGPTTPLPPYVGSSSKDHVGIIKRNPPISAEALDTVASFRRISWSVALLEVERGFSFRTEQR